MFSRILITTLWLELRRLQWLFGVLGLLLLIVVLSEFEAVPVANFSLGSLGFAYVGLGALLFLYAWLIRGQERVSGFASLQQLSCAGGVGIVSAYFLVHWFLVTFFSLLAALSINFLSIVDGLLLTAYFSFTLAAPFLAGTILLYYLGNAYAPGAGYLTMVAKFVCLFSFFIYVLPLIVEYFYFTEDWSQAGLHIDGLNFDLPYKWPLASSTLTLLFLGLSILIHEEQEV